MQIIRAYSERGQTPMNITHTILATVGSIIVMFAISKLLGNKQISQLTLFDYINGITIGSIASEMAVSQEMDELIVPVIAMVLYGLTGFLLSVLTMKSIHCRHFLSGKPILLIEKGKIYPENLKTAKLDVNDLLSRARTSGYFDISKIYYAILETNGTISFMERATEAPLTPKDLGYEKQDEKLCTDLILDGVIMEDNLKYAGKEIKWLTNEIRKQGCSSPDKVFLCIVDGNDKVTVFPKTQQQEDLLRLNLLQKLVQLLCKPAHRQTNNVIKVSVYLFHKKCSKPLYAVSPRLIHRLAAFHIGFYLLVGKLSESHCGINGKATVTTASAKGNACYNMMSLA